MEVTWRSPGGHLVVWAGDLQRQSGRCAVFTEQKYTTKGGRERERKTEREREPINELNSCMFMSVVVVNPLIIIMYLYYCSHFSLYPSDVPCVKIYVLFM